MTVDHYVNRKAAQHEVIHTHIMKEGAFSIMAECRRPDGKGASWYPIWQKDTEVDGIFSSSEAAETLARTISEYPEVIRTVVIKIGKHLEIPGRSSPDS